MRTDPHSPVDLREAGLPFRGRPAFMMAVALGGAAAAPLSARAADTPMYYLETFGAKGDMTVPLLWGLIAVSVLVVVIISAMVIIGILRRRDPDLQAGGRIIAVSRPPGGIGWIHAGLALTTIVLIGFTAWTVDLMARIAAPGREPAFTIEVTAQQFWWEARYVDPDDPARSFETANELHIPLGEPVRIKLRSTDVIHSFWVPALSGKTDAIPGQVNETWIQGDRVGVYRGQCTEYCGQQHTNMAMRMFVDAPDDFMAWWDAQAAAAEPTSPGSLADTGRQAFRLRCGACHTVRGTRSAGEVGPDLTHLMSRTTIASAMLPNTKGHLSGWIAAPQALKPGSHMPDTGISGPELHAIRTYLATLD